MNCQSGATTLAFAFPPDCERAGAKDKAGLEVVVAQLVDNSDGADIRASKTLIDMPKDVKRQPR